MGVKKVLVILIFALLAAAAVVALAFRRAPALIEAALERQLGKDATLSGVRYHFPLGLEIQKLALVERGEFAGETSFYVENVSLSLDAPALIGGRVLIPYIRIKNPQITIRNYHGRLVHAFSKPESVAPSGAAPGVGADSSGSGRKVPLNITRLTIEEGYLKWVDYDISPEGFALVCRVAEANLTNLSLERENVRTAYDLKAEIQQTRERAPAQITLSGWTNFMTYDTDARATLKNLWLPYYAPYYARVSSSVIGDGTLDLQSTTRVEAKKVLTNARLDLHSLAFASFEPEGKLFGFEAAPLIEILRTKSGRITLDLVIERDLGDPRETMREAMRRSIEKSIKATFLNNIQTVVENTLQRIAEDPDSLKKDWKSLVDQFKKTAD